MCLGKGLRQVLGHGPKQEPRQGLRQWQVLRQWPRQGLGQWPGQVFRQWLGQALAVASAVAGAYAVA